MRNHTKISQQVSNGINSALFIFDCIHQIVEGVAIFAPRLAVLGSFKHVANQLVIILFEYTVPNNLFCHLASFLDFEGAVEVDQFVDELFSKEHFDGVIKP